MKPRAAEVIDHSLFEKGASTWVEAYESHRKRPRQARAKATVDALLEATSQVLIDGGYDRLTTTRVAERAGVSVGTLYQYFADKTELVRSVHEAYMERAFGALETEALNTQATPLHPRIEAMLSALLSVKSERPELFTALHAAMLELDGPTYLRRTIERTQTLVRGLLDAYQDELTVDDLDLAAFVTTNAVDGVIGTAVATGQLDNPRLIKNLTRLVIGYLRGHAPPA